MQYVLLAVIGICMPLAAHGAYWEPGTGAAPETHAYTICDTLRQYCYYAELEFIAPVLHNQTPYWVVRADHTILAGLPTEMPPDVAFPPDTAFEITGDPVHDIPLLDDSAPPGIPTRTYVLLYSDMMHTPFVDYSRTVADSLNDVLFGINDFLDGPGVVRVGEVWGDVAVMESVDGLYIIQYVGEGSARFLVDRDRPIPLAGVYVADRYDPHIQNSFWFYSEKRYMDMLYGIQDGVGVDVSGPDNVMRAGTLSGVSWSSDTYQVQSISRSYNTAAIRGVSDGGGILHIVMPAFGGTFTFWQGNTMLDATYDVVGGVLSATITHHTSDMITIHSIPNDMCTGDCIQDMVVRAWDGATGIVYGNGFHGAVRMSLVSGDPDNVAAAICPPGSVVTVDFDVIHSSYAPLVIPYATTYESVLDVDITREGSTIHVDATGEPAAITLRMPAMIGNITYMADGTVLEPLVSSTYHDVVTATIQHVGDAMQYTISADGPTAWDAGLAIPPPVSRTGAIWCGMAEPVNAAMIRHGGVSRADCGLTKFDGGWNVWC